MDKGTITEGMQLLENHRKAESAYKQTYEAYLEWYCANMPRNVITRYKLSQFIADNAFPIASIACFAIGFILGWYWGN